MTTAAATEPEEVELSPGPGWIWGLRHALVLVLFAAVALNTEAGRIMGDTKIDLVVNPGAFLARAIHLWDPLGSGGQLQNQAYGYLFPMGSFFWAADAIGLPGWVTQRLWWALLLGVSYSGFVMLARRLGLGGEWSRLIGGVAFALSPHVLTVLGRSSVEVWPPALAPWILLPLVGRVALDRPVRAAALSGVAIAWTGGVNAAVNLAAVLPAVLWLGTRSWSRNLARLTAAWVVAALAATLWWAIPLLALGRYSPPFLDFIESASFTTSTTALVQVLRGTANWVGYVWGSGSDAGFALLTVRETILMSVVVTAAGLAGVALSGTAHRRYLATLLFVGVALVSLGHAAPIEGFFVDEVRAALDGPLAPIRNVHKFDILIRLALSLGLVGLLSVVASGRTIAQVRFQRVVIAVAAASAIAGSASSFFGLAAAPARSFDGVPSYWSAATDWLGEHQAQGRTMLLPGSRFADYTWGYPADEPIQATDTVAWDVRNAVPLTDPAHVRWLDGLERRMADGIGGADLAPALVQGGIGYVLVRSDLNYGAQGATRPSIVRGALAGSPGLHKVAQFGPQVGGPGTDALVSDAKLSPAAPAIEIYQVDQGASLVSLVPAASTRRVVGGAEAASEPAGVTTGSVLVGTARPAAPAEVTGSVVLTDTPRRREVNVGVGAFGNSFTLSMDDPRRLSTAVRDYGADDRPGAEAVVRVLDGVQLAASSSAGDADAVPRPDRAAAPYAAFDPSTQTAWRPAPSQDPVGSWVEATFPRPIDLTNGVVLLDAASAVREVTVTTTAGSTSLDVLDDRAQLPAISTSMLRVTIASVAAGRPTEGLGIRTVSIPSVTIARTVALPAAPAGTSVNQVRLVGDIGRPGCVPASDRMFCATTVRRDGEDSAGLDRMISVEERLPVEVTGTVRAVTTPALVALVREALALPVEVDGSSAAVPDLAGDAQVAVDADPTTTWVSGPEDLDPTLRLRWDGAVAVSGLRLDLDPNAAATAPTRVRIVAGNQTREAPVQPGGTVDFDPVYTDELEVHLAAETRVRSLDPYDLVERDLGLGVSEVVIDNVPRPGRHALMTDPTLVEVPCGQGPPVLVGRTVVDTAVRAEVGQLIRGEAVDLVMCTTEPVVIEAGRSRIRAGQGDQWLAASLQLTRVGTPLSTATPLPVQPSRWTSASRTVALPERREPTILRVRENTNPGWRARAGATVLSAVTIDGWQQGWLVPAGPAVSVDLVFTPDPVVRTGMLIGALLVAALAAVAAWSARRREYADAALRTRPGARRDATTIPGGPPILVAGVGVLALVSTAGMLGLVVAVLAAGGWWGGRLRRGPASAALPGWAHRWLPTGGLTQWSAVVAAGCYAVAGLTIVLRPYGHSGYLGNSTLTQAFALLALAAVLVTVLPPREPREAASDEPSAEWDVRSSAG